MAQQYNTESSTWSGEFVDRDLERLFWHETWPGWSKAVGYAGLIIGVVLALIVCPRKTIGNSDLARISLFFYLCGRSRP